MRAGAALPPHEVVLLHIIVFFILFEGDVFSEQVTLLVVGLVIHVRVDVNHAHTVSVLGLLNSQFVVLVQVLRNLLRSINLKIEEREFVNFNLEMRVYFFKFLCLA